MADSQRDSLNILLLPDSDNYWKVGLPSVILNFRYARLSLPIESDERARPRPLTY